MMPEPMKIAKHPEVVKLKKRIAELEPDALKWRALTNAIRAKANEQEMGFPLCIVLGVATRYADNDCYLHEEWSEIIGALAADVNAGQEEPT